MKTIPLTRGTVATVDDEDFEWLSRWKWRLSGNGMYAVREQRDANGRVRIIFMHREILRTPPDRETDHINRDGLDNRLVNLRVATHSQNQANQPKTRKYKGLPTSSQFVGVRLHRKHGGWMVYVSNRYIGYYASEEAAARAYDHAARELFGEFANLNFP